MGKRDVVTVDVTGAYVHADMLDYNLLKLKDEAVDIMCKINGDYKKIVRWERGKRLWYALFTTTLKDLG